MDSPRRNPTTFRPQGKGLRKVFGDLPLDRILGGFRVVCFLDHEVDDQGARRLGKERTRFLEVLADKASPAQVHVQHYLIVPEKIGEDYPYSYGDAAFLRQAIDDSGRVKLVLSGHYHPGVPLCKKKKTYYSVVPAFCEEPHRFRFYELDSSGVSMREETLSI